MRGLLVSARDAFCFLTVLPLPCPLACPLVSPDSGQRLVKAMGWFPLVGAFVGLAGASIFLALEALPKSTAAFLSLGLMAILTGGIHLDGFSDTVDGLAACKDRQERLRIMDDSRMGAFGAIGLFLLLSLKWSLIVSLTSQRILESLVSACALGRWAIVLSAQGFPYVASKSGLGRLVTDQKDLRSVGLATAVCAGIVSWAVGFSSAPILLLITLGLVGLFNGWVLLRLSGITGDTLGAMNEVVEVSLLVFFACL